MEYYKVVNKRFFFTLFFSEKIVLNLWLAYKEKIALRLKLLLLEFFFFFFV